MQTNEQVVDSWRGWPCLWSGLAAPIVVGLLFWWSIAQPYQAGAILLTEIVVLILLPYKIRVEATREPAGLCREIHWVPENHFCCACRPSCWTN